MAIRSEVVDDVDGDRVQSDVIGQAVELEVIGDVDVDVGLIGSVVMSDTDGGMVG